MKATITTDNAGNPVLKVEVALTENKQSRSGNSTIVATSRGQQFIGNVKGKPTYLQLNVMQMQETGGGLEVSNEIEDSASPTRRRAA